MRRTVWDVKSELFMRRVAEQPSPSSDCFFFSSWGESRFHSKKEKTQQDDGGHMMREGDSLQA